MTGEVLDKNIRNLFNLTPQQQITPTMLNYAMTLIDPVSYVLHHLKIQGNPITFDVPNYDQNRAVAHRPWQNKILRASASEVRGLCVIRSRHLSLSDVGV